ncbi:BLUF domain-containing protein [Hymenobacter ruber]
MSLYQLIYQSQSLVPFDTPELTALLIQCRANNLREDITGLLLYTPDGRFLQVLEGTPEAVRRLYYQHIAVDPRHFSCRVLSEGPCRHRAFSNWRMGFRVAQPQHMRTLLGYVPPDSPALLVPRPHTRPELLELLRDFVAHGEVEPWLEHPRM